MTHLIKKSLRRIIAKQSVLYATGYPERHFPAGMRPQPGNKRSINYAK